MKALILCGGKGTRLSEETRKIPKPMVRIGKHPVILHIINFYFSFNIKQFILTTGYLGKIINEYFIKEFPLIKKLDRTITTKKDLQILDYSNGLRIFLLNTGLNTETGGRILRAKKIIENDKFFHLTYGDGLSNININKSINFFLKNRCIGLITAVRPPARFGKLSIRGRYVKKFEEKNQLDEGWINGGYFIFSKDIFKYIKNDSTNFEMYSLKKLAYDNQLILIKHRDFWQCMDTLREKIILNNLLKRKITPWIVEKKLF